MDTETLLLVAWIVLFLVNIILLRSFGKLRRMLANASRPKQERTERSIAEGGACPSVSIIITAHNQADDLQEHLPIFLGQDYPSPYNVIVVDIHSNDQTSDVLEKLESTYPNLRCIKLPTSARDISLQCLALLLGMRASEAEWVVSTNVGCEPTSNEWLRKFMSSCTEASDVVLGNTLYDSQSGWTQRCRQFFSTWQSMLWMPYAVHHAPYRVNESCIAYRRERFLQQDVFDGSSSLVAGVHTVLANQNTAPGRCAISVSPSCALRETTPSARMSRQERLFFMETRRHLRRVLSYRLHYGAQLLFPLALTLFALFVVTMFRDEYLLPSLAVASWLIILVIRWTMYGRSARALGVRGTSIVYPIGGLLILWLDAKAYISWLVTGKNTFRKKFV